MTTIQISSTTLPRKSLPGGSGTAAVAARPRFRRADVPVCETVAAIVATLAAGGDVDVHDTAGEQMPAHWDGAIPLYGGGVLIVGEVAEGVRVTVSIPADRLHLVTVDPLPNG